MKFKLIVVSLIMALSFIDSQAQSNTNDEYVVVKKRKMTMRRKNNKSCYLAINKLKKNGAILFMIRDRKINTEMLKEKGLENKAKEIEAKQQLKNKIIVSGLARAFKFCPIYFFYQSDLEKIQKGEIAQNLVDTNFVKGGIIFNHDYFLILDYGDLYNEQGKLYNDTSTFDQTTKIAVKNNTFVLKNKYLSQLVDPLPYYFTCHYPAKDILIRTKRFSDKLNRFYRKHGEE